MEDFLGQEFLIGCFAVIIVLLAFFSCIAIKLEEGWEPVSQGLHSARGTMATCLTEIFDLRQPLYCHAFIIPATLDVSNRGVERG